MLDALLFIVSNYWPFLALAMVLGIVTGWVSHDDDHAGGEH